jgi:hypothetical protein
VAGVDRSAPDGRSRLGAFASPAPFLIALAILIVLRPQGDPDYWWHVRVGDWILANGATPHTELLSWLSGGGSWTAPSWASEVLLSLLDRATGPAGSAVLFFIVSMAILAMVAVLARHVRPSLGAGALSGLVFAAALVMNPVWLPRAQLWDVLFVLVGLYAMLRYLDEGWTRGLVLMPIVMVAWANLHGAGTLVYLLLAAGVIAGEMWNRRARRRPGRPWRPLVLSVLITVLAISVNPYGPSLYVYGFTTTASGPTADYILEWQSPNFHTLILRPAQAFIAFGLVGALAFVRMRDARIVALVAGFTFMTLQSGRYLEFLIPVSLGVAGPALIAATWRILAPLALVRLHFTRRHRVFVGVVGGTLGLVLLLGRVVAMPGLQDESVRGYQPVDAAAWLKQNPQSGRLFSEYGWGGYLSYQLGVPVGPYGASDAFGDATLVEIQGVFNGSLDPGAYFDRNSVDTVVVPGESVIGHYLAASEGWREVYRDERAVVFRREVPGA